MSSFRSQKWVMNICFSERNSALNSAAVCEWFCPDRRTVFFVFFVFARVPVLLYLFKETWYWDSSNVTDMVMSGVKCMGNEMALSQCQYHKTVSCQRAAAKFAAGVICSESEWHGDKQKLWLFIFMWICSKIKLLLTSWNSVALIQSSNCREKKE